MLPREVCSSPRNVSMLARAAWSSELSSFITVLFFIKESNDSFWDNTSFVMVSTFSLMFSRIGSGVVAVIPSVVAVVVM